MNTATEISPIEARRQKLENQLWSIELVQESNGYGLYRSDAGWAVVRRDERANQIRPLVGGQFANGCNSKRAIHSMARWTTEESAYATFKRVVAS